MTCHRPEKIEAYLDQYNTSTDLGENEKVLDYFIPALAIRRRKVTRSVEEERSGNTDTTKRKQDEDRKSNELRGGIHKFVFLQASSAALDKLHGQYWNTGATCLWHYRNKEGGEIIVRDELMRKFINGCLEYGEKFELRTKDTDIDEGMKVTVRQGQFKDFEAEIYNVHYKGDGVRFSIAIKFFANDQYIHIHDRTPDFVTLHDQDSFVFNADFIDRIESTLLTILSRRVKKKEADPKTIKTENEQLQRLYYLHHAIIDDPLLNTQLIALMAICAILSKNALEKSKYNRLLKQRIKDLRQQPADTQNQTALAYLLTALFLSTKDPKYRRELKTLVLQQLPEHPTLRKFLALLRQL